MSSRLKKEGGWGREERKEGRRTKVKTGKIVIVKPVEMELFEKC